MSRAAWVVVATSAVICGALALSPGSIAEAEGEDDWLTPATSTSAAAPTTTTPSTTTTSTTAPSTTTTEDEWLSPATSAPATTTPEATTTTTTATTTSTSRPGGGASGSDNPGNAPTSTTVAACHFLNPSTGELEPGLPEDCEGQLANPPDPTVSTVTSPTTKKPPKTSSPSTIPGVVDPATTTLPAGPAPTGSIPPATGPTGPNEQAAEAPTTTSGTIQQVDVDLTPQRVSVKSIGVEPGDEEPPAAVTAEQGYDPDLLAAGAQVRLDTRPSFVFTFPWDRSNPIGVELGPGRVLGAWVIWMTITLLVMAFWVPSPTRRARRATARAAAGSAHRA